MLKSRLLLVELIVTIPVCLLWICPLVCCLQSHVRRPHGASIDQPHATEIICPGDAFRCTKPGELSVASFNILAPSYHWLGMENDDGNNNKDSLIDHDRQNRVPMAIRLAKKTNADILCLQEVEGGPCEELLKEVLAQPQNGHPGYDSFLWSALHPNRKGDIVGLCVAWRSKKQHLLSSDCFRRGMVIQFEEIDTGATFCIGNVHLPAKPSSIEGRLRALSTTVKSLETHESSRRLSALDGTLIIAGDFNCDQYSIAARLLETGVVPHGTIHERNYKAKVSKDAAYAMKHGFRFKDAYANPLRQIAAPVTVALTGRGPGCMDHIFYASQDSQGEFLRTVTSDTYFLAGKRKARREKAMQRVAHATKAQHSRLRVATVLATIDSNEPNRAEIIANGLPNVDAGFPSDHIPIGVLLSPDPRPLSADLLRNVSKDGDEDAAIQNRHQGGISANARRRREAYSRSLVVRRRHNAILRALTEWLVDRGAENLIRDQPLFKWKWLRGVQNISGKLRAPDLCCVIRGALIIVEVTVASKPDEMRRVKLDKYRDLASLLRTAPALQGVNVYDTFVILLDEDGRVPEATWQDVLRLTELSTLSPNDKVWNDAKLFCHHLQRVFYDAMKKTELGNSQHLLK